MLQRKDVHHHQILMLLPVEQNLSLMKCLQVRKLKRQPPRTKNQDDNHQENLKITKNYVLNKLLCCIKMYLFDFGFLISGVTGWFFEFWFFSSLRFIFCQIFYAYLLLLRPVQNFATIILKFAE